MNETDFRALAAAKKTKKKWKTFTIIMEKIYHLKILQSFRAKFLEKIGKNVFAFFVALILIFDEDFFTWVYR